MPDNYNCWNCMLQPEVCCSAEKPDDCQHYPSQSPSIEELAKLLHEAGRKPVELGHVVKQSITFKCCACGEDYHQGEAGIHHDPERFACPACHKEWVIAMPVNGKVEKFLSWDEISEAAREGRRDQARFLVQHLRVERR